MTYEPCKGIVKGKIVALEETANLPEGAEVLVTPIETEKGSPQAILSAAISPPHLNPEDVNELMTLIEDGKRPVCFDSPSFQKGKIGIKGR